MAEFVAFCGRNVLRSAVSSSPNALQSVAHLAQTTSPIISEQTSDRIIRSANDCSFEIESLALQYKRFIGFAHPYLFTSLLTLK
ncbi:MAG TPA: hypothetical protein DD473_23700 [Planctomycetaceae bacterium]|nr:hypothetical protein [Planctomycetaceae bacterium]